MNKYQELSDKVEEVKTGKNEAMLVEPLINLAESFREITKRQAEELRDLLAKNYQEYEEHLKKEELRATKLEKFLEQIKEGKVKDIDIYNLPLQLNLDEKQFLINANSLVQGIKSAKEAREHRGKKYSLNDPRENANWQEWITQNSKNDDQKVKLEKILNYWKSQEKNGPNNPNQEFNGEKFPLVPLIIGGGLFLGLVILLLVFSKKKK